MRKVVILWFNFSRSLSYPDGPVSSGLSLYTANLLDKNIGCQKNACGCGCIKKRTINVNNRRDMYLDILDITTLDGKIDVDLNIYFFYELIKQTIKEEYINTFDFENRNIAVCIDDEDFDHLKILEKFKDKLANHYKFNTESIRVLPVDEEDVTSIPFMNVDDNVIGKFTSWVAM
jgi:hypothetical protein